jgi:hypothetical protein
MDHLFAVPLTLNGIKRSRNIWVYPKGKALANKSVLSLSWLRRTFNTLPEDADENKVQQFIHAYLLCLLGSILLVDLTGDSVPCIYLTLLANLDFPLTKDLTISLGINLLLLLLLCISILFVVLFMHLRCSMKYF